MSDKPAKDHGKNIGEIVRSALQSGDLSRLADLGPAVGEVVKDATSAVQTEVQKAAAQWDSGDKERKPTGGQQAVQPPPYHGPPARQAWQGRGAEPRKKLPGRSLGYGAIGFGVLGMVFFGLGCVAAAVLPLLAGSAPLWALSGLCGGAFVASGIAIGAGMNSRRFVKRVWQYAALLEKKPVYTIDELGEKTGIPTKRIKQDVRKALRLKLMPGLRTDANQTCLIQGDEAYKLYLESEEARRQREAEEADKQRRLQDPATANLEYFRQEGEATREKIRRVNAALPDEVVSEKLDRLEATTTRIFDYVEQHPEKLPDTRKFMSYYLPTTLKLVEKYQQYEEMEVQPANVVQAKKDILRTLDTIDEAFNNMLESMYQPDTMDVSTDITVLEKMLEQEGLTGKRFTVEDAQDVSFTPIDEA